MNKQNAEAKAFVQKAYDFSKKAHEGQLRKSGEPFFEHVVHTAIRLAEAGLDEIAIAGGLLHDTLEDTDVTPEQIEKEFGPEVLFLVDGVTRLGSIKYKGDKAHVESLRRLFVATAQDIRVILIKLFDRLHNMETLEYHDAARRKRKSLETLEIYAPVAERLGMGALKSQLEDLAFKFINPEQYTKTLRLRKTNRLENQASFDKAHKAIKRELAEAGVLKYKTEVRIKSVYSLHKKLQIKGSIENIHDIAAIRIIVPEVSECYKVLGIIHNKWRPLPGRIKDYIAVAKPNGYQSLHTTVFTGDGGIVEVQIRTDEMHQQAEYGVASHIGYKARSTDKVAEKENKAWSDIISSLLNMRGSKSGVSGVAVSSESPKWMKELAEAHTDGENKEFMKGLRQDFFSRRIFVFTPRGDVIDLPVGSSPLDFAYAVHTKVGDHTSAAKINGKMVALSTCLKNGDIVEIVTKESAKPSRKWMDIVKTTMAKRKINASLSREIRETEESK